MKNVAFTIVAENYLPLARALGWSLKNHNTTPIDFIIFVSDKFRINEQLRSQSEVLISLSDLKIENIEDLAFKYNVTEFCTAIKPSCFKYIFEILSADNAIYFDPDIFVFNDIAPIIDDLTRRDIIVTPHFITPQINYSGDETEKMIFFVGIYNFGFLALKNNADNRFILDWWENRLMNQCFGDKQDALHTDQKWGDFLPVFAGDRLMISKSIGYNVAPWNLFERKILKIEGRFYVENRFTKNTEDLIFVHFAGYDPNDMKVIHKYMFNLTIDKYPEYNLIRDVYNEVTQMFEFEKHKNVPYAFSSFSTGEYIHDYHRRIYRALKENGHTIPTPFDVNGWFFNLLKKNHMISYSKPVKVTTKEFKKYDRSKRMLDFVMRYLFLFLGTDRYFKLMLLFNRYSRPENQIFLLKEKIDKFY